MVTREDLESFLIRMDVDYEELEEGMFLVQSKTGGAPMVVHHSPPLLLVRLKVTDLPEHDTGFFDLYKRLLVLNASDVVHGAYGIEDGELILSDTLELETLDYHELVSSAESIALAASSHLEQIKSLMGSAVEG